MVSNLDFSHQLFNIWEGESPIPVMVITILQQGNVRILSFSQGFFFFFCNNLLFAKQTNKKHTLSTLKQHTQKKKQEKNKINNKVLTGKEERRVHNDAQ